MTAKYVLDEIEKCIPEWPFQFVCAGYFEVRDKVWKLRKQLEEEENYKAQKGEEI